MIQFNLLPDIKLEYIRAQRVKRTVMVISIAVTAAALALVIFLIISVKVVQRGHIDNLTKDIKSSSNKLKGTEDINKILTIQNQLNSLGGLHESKTASTRVISFMGQVTPTDVTISNLDVNFTDKVITITGASSGLVGVNRYVDTLKFTDYKNGEEKNRAFSEVVLSSFGKSEKSVSYTITLKYAEVLFNNNADVKLEVPFNTITTRSEQEKPDLLFEPSPANSNEGGQQ